MKLLDKVKLIRNRDEYLKKNIHEGDIGTIWFAEIKDNRFYVVFQFSTPTKEQKEADILIDDLEFIEDGNCSDESILQDIPKNNPKWWCKVEDGYIINLLGEKKNKIPYDYNS